MQTSKNLRV